MESNPCLLFLLFFMLSGIVAETHGSCQGEKLDNLYKTEFNGNSGIDTSPFVALDINHFDESENVEKTHPHQKGLKENNRIQKIAGQQQV